ncbi:MAG: heterodisulfide reductase-related iron-sulfur binding cluster [Solirubrobacterales bacterium]
MGLLAATKTRPVFWGLGPWLEALWYVLALLSVAVFAYGVVRLVRKYGRGRGQSWPARRRRDLPREVAGAARELLSQARIKRRARAAGWAHQGIFFGFVVLFIGTVVLAFETDFTAPVFGWRYFHGDFYLAYKEALNVAGTVLVAGLLAMMIRRASSRSVRLDYARPDRAPQEPQFDRRIYRRGDWAFLTLLLLIALTGFVLEGVRIAMEQPGYGGTQFAGWLIAQPLVGVGEATLAGLRHGLWWFHGLLAISVVAAIPYTKAAHMLTSTASLARSDPDAGKHLQPVPADRAAEPPGYGSLLDFSPRHLLQLDACTRCGKCHEACPANATGLPLSPRDLVLELREQANHAAAGVSGVLGGLLGARDEAELSAPVIGSQKLRSDTVWSCMQCNACVEICPVGIEQAPIINQLRRRLVDDGELDAGLQSTLETIHKSGNSFGQSRRRRGRWTEGLDFEVTDARKKPVEILWFVGDYAAFDPRAQEASRSLARILRAAGVDFGIMYEGERNAGNDVRRVGEEGLFESLAEQNIAAIEGCEFDRILTSDPHSLNTLRHEYPELGGEWTVLHHTALLLELLDEGRLRVAEPLARRATYHDPCHLGRFQGEYESPRRILELLGCTVVEMPRNRDNSFCCGAGGGRIWFAEEGGAERPSESRIREAVGLPDVDLFVVSCPKDVVMYEAAIRSSGNEERIQLREMTELVESAVLASGVEEGAVC